MELLNAEINIIPGGNTMGITKANFKNGHAYISVIRSSLDYGAVTLGYYLFVLRHNQFCSIWLN